MHFVFANPLPSLIDYISPMMSFRSALLALYHGVTLFKLDIAGGVASLKFDSVFVSVPISILRSPVPPVNTTLDITEAIQIGHEVCRAASWLVCFDFLRARRSEPLFRDLYNEALLQICGGGNWVLSHGLQIKSAGVQTALISAFTYLSTTIANSHTLLSLIETTFEKTLKLDVEQLEDFISFTDAFQLKLSLETVHNVQPQIVVSDAVNLYCSLRDWAFVTIVCLASPASVFKQVPDLYKLPQSG